MIQVTTEQYEEVTTLDDNDFPATTQKIHASQKTIINLKSKLNSKNYELKKMDGIPLVFKNNKIVIGGELFREILEWYHLNLNHPGQDRTYRTISSVLFASDMEKQVRAYVDNCQVCKKSKTPNKKYGIIPEPETTYTPWEVIQIDLFGPWSFTDINGVSHQIQGLSIIDIATRWVELCPIASKRSEDIALLVDQQWFCRYPRPRAAIFDNGSEFSSEFLDLLSSYGVTPKPTTIKNPQANAFVERIHHVIAASIRSLQLDQRPFDDTTINAVLQGVAYGLRATYHSSLHASPGQIVFGRDMIINATYLANWKFQQLQRQKQMTLNNKKENRSRTPHSYQIGDLAYIRRSGIEQKLSPMQGPFRIDEIHTNGTVTIRRSPTVTERINQRRLHPASTRSN